MMLVQNRTDIRTITDTARRVGVTLPADITEQADHLEALDNETRQATTLDPRAQVKELVQHLGDPKAMDKARAKAAADNAAAEADRKIGAALVDYAAAVLTTRMRQRADDIAAAFETAARPHLDVLSTDAKTLPLGFRPEDADTLTPEQYAAWTRGRDAQGNLEAIRAALRPLYNLAPDGMFTADAVRALSYIQPPTKDVDLPAAHGIARALAGTRHGGSNLGPVNVEGVWAPALCAHLGCTFVWATPSEVQARADALNTAATPTKVERRGITV